MYALPKTGKRDLTKVKSYRLISLLYYQGKGLKHLAVRRIYALAVQY